MNNDTKRIDWLDKECCPEIFYTQTFCNGEGEYDGVRRRKYYLIDYNVEASTLREAIDMAMKK